ncbi:hypothetical protein, conserved [Angomonas deanei]|uniref:Uncharacterized protein n=1 Tax=Angomonas deanei TaxID=59799 RepID=A0A7G2CG02_9TRYP|nr:hypothetical protein, conserved [Angomonas deanei]
MLLYNGNSQHTSSIPPTLLLAHTILVPSLMSAGPVIRCTRRIRDPLNYLILQPTDLDTVVNRIYTRHAGVFTFYMPLLNIQSILHKRYEAEKVAELILPKGVAPPPVRSLTLTEENVFASVMEKQTENNNKKEEDDSNNTQYAKFLKRMAGYKGNSAKVIAKLNNANKNNTLFSSFMMSAPSKEQIYRNENNNQVTSEEEKILAKGALPQEAGRGKEEREAYVHAATDSQYTVNEKGETIVPLGLVTLIVGENYPLIGSPEESSSTQNSFFDFSKRFSLLQRLFYGKIDPLPYTTVSLRCLVVDRIHWQRTSWLAGSICSSYCYGMIPNKIFSIELDYKRPVFINGGEEEEAEGKAPQTNNNKKKEIQYDFEKGQYTTPYQVEIPGHDFRLTLQDTGTSLFNVNLDWKEEKEKDSFELHNKVVDGFVENESALHRLGLSREVNMIGLGGSVYRQTLWSTPSLPNIARPHPNKKKNSIQYGSLFRHYFGCDPVGPPVALWLVNEIPQTLIYQMEGEVEDENDPNSATTYGDRSLTERVQKKAMNRYNNFRDDLRGKTYSDIGGEEMPR